MYVCRIFEWLGADSFCSLPMLSRSAYLLRHLNSVPRSTKGFTQKAYMTTPKYLCEPSLTYTTSLSKSYPSHAEPLFPTTAPSDTAILAQTLYTFPIPVLCIDDSVPSYFAYANLAAQSLFGYTFDEFLLTPSSLSAEESGRMEREKLLEECRRIGWSKYNNLIRVRKDGSKFKIVEAIVWNLTNEMGKYIGQAAALREWKSL